MPTAKFVADFNNFNAAVEAAETKVIGFEASSNKVAQSLGRLTDSFSGTKVIQDATLMASAVERVGGVSSLTEKELSRVSAVAGEAVEKLKRLGEEVPPGLQLLADAAKKSNDNLVPVNKTVSEASGFFSDLSVKITSVAAGFVSAEAVTAAVSSVYRTLSGFVRDSVKAYADAESAQVKLVAALRQHSLATPEVIDQYNRLGATFQQTTKYSDDEINSMQALLTQVGGVMPSAMEGALKASTNLASGLGIDLHSATQLVAKAAAGHTETLGRYGITVSAADVATRGFDAVLEAINRQFGGQAQAELDTYAGRVAQIGNSWNNVQEAVGKAIVQNPIVVASLKAIQEATEKGDKATQDATASWVGFAKFVGFEHAAVVIAALEAYANAANEVDRINKQIASVPSPFAKWIQDGALPAVTAGMKLFNEQTAETERLNKKATEALHAYTDAMVEINAAGIGWAGTVSGINGSVVEAIKFYLQAGVSQNVLAAAYELTTAQVKSISLALQDSLASEKTLDEFRHAAHARQVEIIRIQIDEQNKLKDLTNAAVLAEFDAQTKLNAAWGVDAVGAIRLQHSALTTLSDKLTELHLKKIEGISQTAQEQLLVDEYTKSLYDEAVALDAVTASTVKQAAATVTATEKFNQFKNTLVLGVKDIDDLNKQLTAFYDKLAAQGNIGIPGPGGVGVPIGNSAGAPRVPTFEMGGPTGAGGPALLHDGEFVVPKGGALVSGGSGGPVTVNLVVDGQVLATIVANHQTRDAFRDRLWPSK